jgi:hypothetical protein
MIDRAPSSRRPGYDAVALLRDSYVELPDAEGGGAARVASAATSRRPDPDTFSVASILTPSRAGKDHARFVCAWRNAATAVPRPSPAAARALRARGAAHGADAALARAEHSARLPDAPCAP